jgi:hypothetical protein
LTSLKAGVLEQVDSTKALHALVCKEIFILRDNLAESQRANQQQAQYVETTLTGRSELLRDFQRINRQLVQAGANFRGRHIQSEGVDHLHKIMLSLSKALRWVETV